MRERLKNEIEVIKLSDKALADSLIRAFSYSQPLTYAGFSGMSRKIVDVNVIVPNKVVEVTFMNGDKQKAVCREPDVFSLEQVISICITKHLLGGTGAYNKAIREGVKLYNKQLETEKMIKEEEERIAKRRAKKAAYMKRKAEKKREEQIEIQKEAYIRAMEAIGKVDVN